MPDSGAGSPLSTRDLEQYGEDNTARRMHARAGKELSMSFMDKIRGLLRGPRKEEPTEEQRANQEDTDRAVDAIRRA